MKALPGRSGPRSQRASTPCTARDVAEVQSTVTQEISFWRNPNSVQPTGFAPPSLSDPKKDADYVFYELTRSICPDCRRVIDGHILIRDNKVYLRKRCPDHGVFEGLVYGDAQLYTNSSKFNKPGTIPVEFSSEVHHGCPHDCGLCPDHQQHACLGIIEVNSACDMACPLCFAEAGPGFNLTLEEVEDILDHYVATEGNPQVVQFSGGEPSIHTQIIPMMRAAQQRDIPNVMLNTNGKRIATDDRFLAELAEVRPNIYFQFDGFESETYRIIRGEADLLPKKLRALDRLAEIDCSVILVPAIEPGVNEHEIGKIVRFGLDHAAVKGINFQPAFHAGRHGRHDPMQRMTNPDVIKLIEEQTEGLFRLSDFIPVPCCFPTCNSVTYAYIDEQRNVTPVPRILNVEDYLDYISNRVMPDLGAEVRRALEGLWSSSAVLGSEKVAREFAFSCSACGLPDGGLDVKGLSNFIFMIMLQDFMDPWTFNQKNLMKCCKEFLLPGGKQIPFCAYNTVGYREQARTQLVAQERGRQAARRAGTKYEVQPVTFSFGESGALPEPLVQVEK
ncbi:MAG: radical SAM protein [Acidobacteria bacterium]|nr:radical SAM protein [Acidobacteriota bacterium]